MSSVRLMKTFLAVAAEGSFAGAAQRVALTQAAVGQQMRALESGFRRPLFERQGKTVVLNEAGRMLLPEARRWVAHYEQMLSSLPSQDAMSGSVRLGAVVSAVRGLVQATLALKERHPLLDLHVSAAKSIDLVEGVLGGELDAALVVREPGAARAELAWEALYSEPMVLLAPRHLPDAPVRELLQRERFIRFDPSQHTGALVERTLRRLRVKPHELLELNAIEGIVELVRAGLGVSVLPLLRGARWAGDARLKVIELPTAEDRQIALVRLRRSDKAAVAVAVARFFSEQRP
ncbi:LysR family transcriptional regulator [Ramlibacter rhizophilus]|uniref:LysR family transcriptional regulator n=1 Tax=Ramlibacter rhizophilus TaxID=1781167 RepID=A0A4Z0BF68_9BURK|nr:LysR family transcriptional regulator [Ramlibacter rhizophilus]TFY96764.1 LysR family transcriptional regulator [Ramlibacter rhizophilus]